MGDFLITMQRIFPEALTLQINKGLSPYYLLTGTDLLLLDEAKVQIIQAAREQGFDEKTEFTVNQETPWDTLLESAQSMGLFFNRQIIILNLPDNITTQQAKQLETLCQLSHSDLLLIFCLPKWTKALEKQNWLHQIDAQAIQVNCQTPEISKLPAWVGMRAKTLSLQIELEAVQLLCYSYEGNLLALKQALQLLQLHFTDGKITLNRAKEIVEQSAQFNPFQWVDALLNGKIARAERILAHLKNEDIQPVMLLRIIQKELMILLELTRSPAPVLHSQTPLYIGNLRAEFDRLKIWQNRRMAYQQACQRLTYQQLYQLIQKLAELERQVKQTFDEQVWIGLAQFSALFK